MLDQMRKMLDQPSSLVPAHLLLMLSPPWGSHCGLARDWKIKHVDGTRQELESSKKLPNTVETKEAREAIGNLRQKVAVVKGDDRGNCSRSASQTRVNYRIIILSHPLLSFWLASNSIVSQLQSGMKSLHQS